MQAYKTTPDKISDILGYQINEEEEGILITNYGFNVFLPNYTERFNETFEEMKEITKSLKDCIKELSGALDNLTSDINQVIPPQTGGLIYKPTFISNIQATNKNLESIKIGLDDIDSKIDDIKEKL